MLDISEVLRSWRCNRIYLGGPAGSQSTRRVYSVKLLLLFVIITKLEASKVGLRAVPAFRGLHVSGPWLTQQHSCCYRLPLGAA